MITDITICKLPYQKHPFVRGLRDGKDVLLMSNGEWTEEDGHPDSDIPLHKSVDLQLWAKSRKQWDP
jgi:hypothetical protein